MTKTIFEEIEEAHKNGDLRRINDLLAESTRAIKEIALAKLLMSLIFQIAAYAILTIVDWRIAVAIFLVQWSIQLTKR